MKKLALIILVAATLALPAEARSKQQSYFTYDDGGTVVRQGDDGREIDARINLPVFPGDEVTTSRRGRSEIRLSDGNIIALDRSTSVQFKSILDSYDGDSAQTVAELHYGEVMVHRIGSGDDEVRIDTVNASYVASADSLYSVETDLQLRDRISVFDGTVEVRTPSRTTRIRSGEEGRIDNQGLYGLVDLPRTGASEFESWFIHRSDSYSGSSRYLDSSLAYSDYDLQTYGSWIYAGGYGGWVWRPRVSVGWRPYFHGSWVRGAYGSLVWVSDESWGWVPYHFGRWAFDSLYGWIWLPGYAYAPAWVYWMWGPTYVGWAPAGWWDCYRPYYNWCYRPYARVGVDFGFGFFGRVRVHDVDLRPWTFVTPNVLFSNRADRAALTTDAVRDRLGRDGSAATVTGAGIRFSREEFKDPSAAVTNIARRGLGGGTGKDGSGSPTDMTSFFRRDPELSTAIRDRIIRTRTSDGNRVSSGTPGMPSTSTVIEGGRISRPGARGEAPAGTTPRPAAGSVIQRGNTPSTPGQAPSSPSPSRDWRDRVQRPAQNEPSTAPSTERPSGSDARPANPQRNDGRDRVQRPAPNPDTVTPQQPRSESNPPAREEWRGRAARPSASSSNQGAVDRPQSRDYSSSRGSDRRSSYSGDRAVPRRVIDRIGGPRVVPDSRGARDATPRSQAPPRVERSTPPPRTEHAAPTSHSSGSSSSSGSGGGHVQRDKH
jgi:hypothetical protein